MIFTSRYCAVLILTVYWLSVCCYRICCWIACTRIQRWDSRSRPSVMHWSSSLAGRHPYLAAPPSPLISHAHQKLSIFCKNLRDHYIFFIAQTTALLHYFCHIMHAELFFSESVSRCFKMHCFVFCFFVFVKCGCVFWKRSFKNNSEEESRSETAWWDFGGRRWQTHLIELVALFAACRSTVTTVWLQKLEDLLLTVASLVSWISRPAWEGRLINETSCTQLYCSEGIFSSVLVISYTMVLKLTIRDISIITG